MLKKPITYDTYDDPPQTVTEDFYFNLTELEAAELDLEYGGIEDTMKRLTETENAKEVYAMFKSILLACYGKKSADGRRFMKRDEDGRPYSRHLEESPALPELIIPMISDASLGAEFFKRVFPAKLYEKIKAAEAAQNASDKTVTPDGEPAEKKVTDYSDAELMEMSKAEFDALAGTDPQKMDSRVMRIALTRKTS